MATTPKKVKEVISTAKESLKLLEALANERKDATNKKIVESLKKIGLVTRADYEALEARVEALEKSGKTA